MQTYCIFLICIFVQISCFCGSAYFVHISAYFHFHKTAPGAQRESFFRSILLPLVLHGFAESLFRLWEFGFHCLALQRYTTVVILLYNIVYYRPGVMYVLLNVIKAEIRLSFTAFTGITTGTTVREQHPRSHHKGTIVVAWGFELATNCIQLCHCQAMPTWTTWRHPYKEMF